MQESVFPLIGGLGIFLFGIHQLTDALKRTSSQSIKDFLKRITASPVLATLIGLLMTTLLQSSSATTVLTVGFVNAGLLTLKQAIGVIFGANIGTTVTAQLMAFKVATFSLPLIALGTFIFLFSRKDVGKQIGVLILGFGMIFYGMTLMGDGVRPWREAPAVVAAFRNLSHHPILAVLTGMLITMVLQSSSATVGLVLTLIGSGLIDLQGAVPLILGDNIGTCITAGLASIGANLSAKRTAAAHFGFNIIGTVIVLLLLPFYMKLILLTASDPVRQAANAHTLFNVFNTILFLPFTSLYAQLIERLIPGTVKVREERAIYLSPTLLQSPSVALDAVHREIRRALSFCRENADIVRRELKSGKSKDLEILVENEQITDNLQLDITHFLVELARQPLSEEQAEAIPRLLHAVNDIERIGDLGERLYRVMRRIRKMDVSFSKSNHEDLDRMLDTVIGYIEFIENAIDRTGPDSMSEAFSFENDLDKMKRVYRKKYLKHLRKDPADGVSGMVYYDVATHLERIGDHLTNIAEAYNAIALKLPL